MNEPAIAKQSNEILAGFLDARRLTMHCMHLEQSLDEERSRSADAETRFESIKQENVKMSILAQTGRTELQRLRQETLCRARAVAQFTKDNERVRMIEETLTDDEASPETVHRLHRATTSEFYSLYPTRPLSREVGQHETRPQTASLSAYQMPG